MKKIFFLLPGQFLRREYFRFGIDILKKNFLVKTLDFTPWLNPELYQDYPNKAFYFRNNVSISSEKDLLNLLNTTQPDIVVDALSNNKKAKRIKKIIKQNSKILFVGLFINTIPHPKTNIKEILKILILKPKKFFYKLFKFVNINYFYNFKFDPCIVGGLHAMSKTKTKELILGHCMDYDIYLDIKNKPVNNNNSYAVFIDDGMTHHSDYSILNQKPPISVDDYYPLLAKFLNKFAIEIKLPVLFATHPKTPDHIIEKFPNLLKGIKYQIGNTAELVRNSKMVLLHQSTAFSFAVLFNKPVVFLTSNKLRDSWIGPRIDNFAKSVNGQIINMDNDLNKPLDFQNLLKIDKSKYKNYLDQYLKVPNSPDIPLWEIFSKYIEKHFTL